MEEGDLHPEEAGGDGLLQDGAPPQSAQVSGPGPAACCSSRKSLLKHLKPLSFIRVEFHIINLMYDYIDSCSLFRILI